MKIGWSLRRALAWSLAAHVLLLYPIAKVTEPERDEAGSPLAVTISAQRPSVRPQLPVVAAAVTKSATPNSLTKPQKPRAAETPMSANSEAVAVALAPNLALPSTSGLAPNADGLRSYRLALAREARRAWAYPAQALTEHWEGTAEIRLELLPGGHLAAARIEKTSGHELLDAAALKMMSSAAASATVPTSLIGDALSIVLPVKFSLEAGNQGKEN